MRSMVPMVEERERQSFFSFLFLFPLSFHRNAFPYALSLLLVGAYYARRALRRGQRGPSAATPAYSPCPPLLLPFSTGTSTERSSVRSRSRSPKTTAAAAAENRCSTPYNHIVVLPSPPSPPSPFFVLDVLVYARLVGTFSQQIA